MDKIALEYPAIFESHRELEEQNALAILANCDLLYAMYPAGYRYKGFRRLSLPIKLSTYIQAQRPIFAHTPTDSSMAQLVSKYKVGVVCASNDPAKIKQAIKNLLHTSVAFEQFEKLRNDLMGNAQVQKLKDSLTTA